MPANVFFDTNVLLYFFDERDPRARIADQLLVQGGRISVQSLNEFANAARRKLQMSWDDLHAALLDLEVLCERPIPITYRLHEAALQIAERYSYGIYDSLILAAAIEGRCEILYSEDMQDGQMVESVRIVNPFKST